LEVKDEKLRKLLVDFGEIFQKELPPRHQALLPEIKIVLKEGAMPVKRKPYRSSLLQAEAIKPDIKRLIANGVVDICHSEWNSPIVVVRKKDGSKRVCVDYRLLNQVTESHAGHIPNLEAQLLKLGGCAIFTHLDLTAGYHQVPITEQSQPLTAFSADLNGQQLCFRVLPFGLKNGPADFSARLSKLFDDLPFIHIYLDDLVIASKSKEEHLRHLREVLTRLKQRRIVLKPTKCKFGVAELTYLGHDIGPKGIKPSAEKTRAITDLPLPTSRVQLQSQLGLLGYYRRFINQYAKKAAPFYDLLKAERFEWPSCLTPKWQDLKQELCSATLQHPNLEESFDVHIDASNGGIGGVVSQSDQPVMFVSRVLQGAEKNYSIPEKEALALLVVIERAAALLAFRKFRVFTDSSALVAVFRSPKSSRLARFIMRMSEFDFSLQHVSGKNNVVADCLSRSSLPQSQVNLIIDTNPESLAQIREAQKLDVEVQRRYLLQPERFQVVNDLMYLRSEPNQLVVPNSFVLQVISDCHDSKLAAHKGYRATLALVRRSFWFPKAAQKVKYFVKTCVKCQLSKGYPVKSTPLRGIETQEPGELLHLDLIGPLPKSKEGHTYVLVILDNFSRFVVLRPLYQKTAAEVTVALLEYIGIFGVPGRIHTDNGTEFRNSLNSNLCKVLGIKRSFTTPYRPQSNGACERINAIIHTSLRVFRTEDTQTEWPLCLPLVAISYNNASTPLTGYSPYQIVFGTHRVVKNLSFTESSPFEHVRALQQKLQMMQEHVRLQRHQEVIRLASLPIQRNIDFRQGMNVKIFSFHTTNTDYKKWQPKWLGPYKVEQVADKTLTLTNGTKSFLVHKHRALPFHSRSMPLVPTLPLPSEIPESGTSFANLVPTLPLPSQISESVISSANLNDLDGDVPDGYFVVERILEHKRIHNKMHYRVRWRGFSESDDTWEPEGHLQPKLVRQYFGLAH